MTDKYFLGDKEVHPVHFSAEKRPFVPKLLNLPEDFNIHWDKYMVVFVPGQGDQLVRKNKIKVRDGGTVE